jgi:release factor glutamine methyltransferase
MIYHRSVTTHSPTADLWTTRRLLAWMGDAFTKKGLDSPRLMAEMLMAHVIGCDRLRLYMDTDRPASPLERESLRDLVGRALKHEPVQYLVGEAWFFGLPFKVDKRVLIPRPATETIVEHVLQHARASHPAKAGGEGLLIADVCTGSGAIAVALLKRLSGARVVACDISKEALAVAHENAVRHGVMDRLELVEGDLLAPLQEHPATRGVESLDYFISNPPYIPDDEWGAVEANVKDHEPHLALRGGVDGLDYVRRLLAGGPALVKKDGLVLIEVADSRAEEAAELARANTMLADVRVLQDFEGLKRVVLARRI